MADFTVLHRIRNRSGHFTIDHARLQAGAALSTSASLDYTSRLRNIHSIEVGYQCTPSLVSLCAVTYTNATTYPGHAVISISGMAATGQKVIDVTAFGGE